MDQTRVGKYTYNIRIFASTFCIIVIFHRHFIDFATFMNYNYYIFYIQRLNTLNSCSSHITYLQVKR